MNDLLRVHMTMVDSAFAPLSKAFALILFLSLNVVAWGQVSVVGNVLDGETGEPMFAASVIVDGTSNGVTTSFDGRFNLNVSSLPVTLNISFIGYTLQQVRVTKPNQRIQVKLLGDQVLIEEAEVVGERISQKQKQAPLTVETMDALAIKEAPTGNFYEGLGNLKGVDLTSASLGFKIVNTRGFNSTSPVRSLQLIDGVDNQSPGLNFSLGNFLGAPDLDVKTVEIVAGASSAYYGPGAFNGVINMETKDPFVFKGLSASYRMGERNLTEWGFRWAESFENKEGDPFFAYKINAFAFSAYDWEATNYGPVEGLTLNDGSPADASNPGGFDAVNIYGDEYVGNMDFSTDVTNELRGLGGIFRTGYKEVDLVDYNTNNLKLSGSGHWRLQPEKTYESPELIYGFNMGRGTTVYQGDNRFSLRDIEFYQHKLELRKKGSWFIRAYRTSEDAGNSYDPYATALRIQDSVRNSLDWRDVYIDFWADSILPVLDETYPVFGLTGDSTNVGSDTFPIWVPTAGYDPEEVELWYAENGDNLGAWHGQVESWANAGYSTVPGIDTDPMGGGLPGSPNFDDLFTHFTSRKNNPTERGTRFFDRSSLIHLHGEKIFKPWWLDEWRVGANGRRYTPNSDGTIFSDTNGRVIENQEIGVYTGVKKRFLEDKWIATATVRADKNENFPLVISPAGSLVWTPNAKNFLRISVSSALRNPTLADQFLFLDVGPATLVGNLNGAEGLTEIGDFNDYRSSSAGLSIGADRSIIDDNLFSIDAIRPEQVRTVEMGYRTTIGESLYCDMNVYRSWYQDFIGYIVGLEVEFWESGLLENSIKSVDVFRYAANSLNQVQTQGASVGLNYFLSDEFSLSGNYSWNKLVKTDEDDPIIPAFNTPEHKFNLGITARGLEGKNKDTWGFGANYRWVQGFVFEGSPQFTGVVPGYDLLDAQVNYNFDARGLTVKVGGSNLLRNNHIETYGGPTVGRLAYISFAMDLN